MDGNERSPATTGYLQYCGGICDLNQELVLDSSEQNQEGLKYVRLFTRVIRARGAE